MLKPFFDMLDHWQSLVAGEIAIPATFLTVGAIWWQSRNDRRRKLRASRALMPAALSLVSDYAELSMAWLQKVRPLIGHTAVNQNFKFPETPEPDSRIFDILKDCVEHADNGPAGAIAELLSAMQVFRSRMIGIAARYPYTGGRVLMDVEVDQQMMEAIKLRARTDNLFPFARRESDSTPQALDWNGFRGLSGSWGWTNTKYKTSGTVWPNSIRQIASSRRAMITLLSP